MLIIHDTIKTKLRKKHGISQPVSMAKQAFNNLSGVLLLDTREENQTAAPTEWFVVKINHKFYKVVFIRIDNNVIIKTMYETKEKYIAIYKEASLTATKKSSKRNYSTLKGLINEQQ